MEDKKRPPQPHPTLNYWCEYHKKWVGALHIVYCFGELGEEKLIDFVYKDNPFLSQRFLRKIRE